MIFVPFPQYVKKIFNIFKTYHRVSSFVSMSMGAKNNTWEIFILKLRHFIITVYDFIFFDQGNFLTSSCIIWKKYLIKFQNGLLFVTVLW